MAAKFRPHSCIFGSRVRHATLNYPKFEIDRCWSSHELTGCKVARHVLKLGCTSRPASLGVEALTGGAEYSSEGLCGSSASAGVASLETSRDCDGEDRPVRVGAGACDVRGRLWVA